MASTEISWIADRLQALCDAAWAALFVAVSLGTECALVLACLRLQLSHMSILGALVETPLESPMCWLTWQPGPARQCVCV